VRFRVPAKEEVNPMVAAAVERRFTLLPVELRGGGNSSKIGGYAAVFDRPSQNLGGFIEVVKRSFFAKSRGDGWPDVLARYNHDDNMLLGTTGAGTLQLTVDDVGLDYEVLPPQSRRDVVELVQRGDVRKSSFAFRISPAPDGSPGDTWALSDQGFPMRELVAGQLVDVAPVNAPAYLDTTSGLRSLADKFEADFEEVRSLAADNELRKFFVRTDGPRPVKPRAFAASAMASLLARKEDPWE
jgi:HK97 family phage prohead protease